MHFKYTYRVLRLQVETPELIELEITKLADQGFRLKFVNALDGSNTQYIFERDAQ